MADLETLLGWRAALEQKRFRGVRSTEYAGARTELKTDEEMRAALDDIERQINRARGTSITCVRVSSSKGL